MALADTEYWREERHVWKTRDETMMGARGQGGEIEMEPTGGTTCSKAIYK